MLYRSAAIAAACLCLSAAQFTRGDDPAAAPSTQAVVEQRKIADALRPSIVKVEYTLQYDKGEAPHGGGGSSRDYDADEPYGYSPSASAYYIQQERPMVVPGFVLANKQIITADPLTPPRFIKSIAVRPNVPGADKPIPAKVSAYMTGQRATMLELESPLPAAAKPLVFDETRKGPYLAVSYAERSTEWVLGLHPLTAGLQQADSGRQFRTAPANPLIVDKAGIPVALNFNSELPADESWRGAPLRWPGLSAADYDKLLAATARRADAGILRVTLNFRSPKNGENNIGYYRSRGNDETAPVQHVHGLLVDAKTVLVLAGLKPAITARLERIKVHPAEGTPVEAKFSKSLTDYGAFVATLEKPLPGALNLTAEPAQKYRDQLLPAAEIRLQGEKRVPYYDHRRISGAFLGWRQNTYPLVSGETQNVFVFDREGALIALPVARREKPSLESSRYSSSDSPTLTNAAQVRAVLADLSNNTDPGNVPLSEADESRLAWLGIELQPLTQDLARANNVSDVSNDGENGALVTYVYPGSPAAKAGIEAGFILLRLYADGQPKPIDIKLENDYDSDRAFPWDRLGEAPESVFDRIPTPWPSVETSLARTLTELGFGKKFTAEFYRDGKPVKKDFEVTQSPTHWNSAPKYKHAGLGLTVRDLTYEVRRYLQKKADDPGVVISKIEMGSKASVAGLKPYELITHVNEQPVTSVKDFEKLTANQEELRFSVKRMTRGRQVKIKLAVTTRPAATQTTTAPVVISPAE